MAYQKTFAKYYDVFYAGKNYQQECDFILSRIQKHFPDNNNSKKLLELACGTGNHSLILAQHKNLEITATDISSDMLKIAAEKAQIRNLPVKFFPMNMIEFTTFENQFDIILCLFDSIGYAKTNGAIASIFLSVFQNLKADGIFIFEFWNAGAMLRSFDPVREKLFTHGGKTIKRVSNTSIDYFHQLAIVNYSILECDSKVDETVIFQETHTNRYFLAQEMKLFLSNAGFNKVEFFPGFQASGEVNEDTWHSVVVCQKS
jgi:SAM-dependent methyltransferase